MIAQLLIHPEITKREEESLQILEENKLKKDHPNVLWLDEDKMGIEQVRKIKDFLSLKPYQGNTQVVVVLQADNLSPDAQNAFLKTLEEPPGETIIILGSSSEDKLLSTITSRCHVVNLEQKLDATPDVARAEKVLSLNMEERFKFVEKLDDKEQFLRSLTFYFREKMLKDKKHIDFLKDLLEAEQWAKQNVNIRAILEYLMLKMPTY